jgi:predicted  nucleic acid-binding Zn-ribbon protein
MAKHTETELAEIEKKVLQAQDRLSDINNAINRDQLIAEQKAKYILVLKKEEDSIKKNIDKLKQSEIDA